jgi:hypothetical protein
MTEAELVSWVGAFADYSDDTRIVYDKQKVIDTLQGYGYVAGEHVGDPAVKTDKTVFAKWLIGQALDGLTCSVGAIHGIAEKFAKDYAKWEEAE